MAPERRGVIPSVEDIDEDRAQRRHNRECDLYPEWKSFYGGLGITADKQCVKCICYSQALQRENMTTCKRKLHRASQLFEPPTADPHGGWCGGWKLESSGYPISRLLKYPLRKRKTSPGDFHFSSFRFAS
ncbi:MAG: hypothetical protein ABIR13_07165 [Polaromonas sp.]